MARSLKTTFFIFILFSTINVAFAQTEVQAWGNITGMRLEGNLFRFESSLRLVDKDWNRERATARERNWTRYRREGSQQVVHTRMDSLFFTETVTDTAPGKAGVKLELDPHESTEFAGVFFHISLPAQDFSEATIQPVEPGKLELAHHTIMPVGNNEILRINAAGITISTIQQKITIMADTSLTIIAKQDPDSGDVGLYFTLKALQAQAGEKLIREFDIRVEGRTVTPTARLKLFPDYPGNTFLGVGGNFRLQNIQNDPQVIDYCLEHLDVRMGRVELPWSFWHPVDSINPLTAARKGDIHPRVKAAMEMAKRLHDMNMPVLLAGWFPPQWAAEGTVKRSARNPDGTYGNALRTDRLEDIYKSITGYILYLKEAYGVEVKMFSFNESDLGINVRHTAREHADFIKGLGAYMRSKGLNTKLLLGDTADANGYEFVDIALDDPETWDYIGAVSFHSWRGWDKSTLLEWYEAADRLNVPLIVGEGSIDAAAWRYPQIFEESHYAIEEIKLYVRMMAICQPQTILQWQLTADYSPLKGGGIFGDDSTSLKPTQRFWNLQQLSKTPKNLNALPLTNTADDLYVTALGSKENGTYAFHLVNEGSEREVILTGLPETLKKLRVYTTNQIKGMDKGKKLTVKNGEVKFSISAASFISLMNE